MSGYPFFNLTNKALVELNYNFNEEAKIRKMRNQKKILTQKTEMGIN